MHGSFAGCVPDSPHPPRTFALTALQTTDPAYEDPYLSTKCQGLLYVKPTPPVPETEPTFRWVPQGPRVTRRSGSSFIKMGQCRGGRKGIVEGARSVEEEMKKKTNEDEE